VLHVLAGLSAGHKIGLGVVGAVFIAFALSASFLAPRRWPDFPGRHGLSPFIIACFVVFAGMLASVYFFGKESEAKGAEAAAPAASSGNRTVTVTEKEYRIVLPTLNGLKAGHYTFEIHNAGQVAHNLAITGPRVSGTPISATIAPGGDGTLQVTLGAPGNYTLFCAIDDHRKLGMVAKIAVG
jgi:uncharacterized cupredoxin-like copper-binding protein